MNIKRLAILMVFAIAVTFTSCSKLEPDLDNVYSTDRILGDPYFAEGLLLQAYRALPNNYSFEEVATDDAVTNDKSSNLLHMTSGSWSAIFNPVEQWSGSYNTIGYLNNFLWAVDQITWSPRSERRDSLFRSRYKGEALALRAYFHFQILVAHGGRDLTGEMKGIPYITSRPDVNDPDSWTLPRPSYAETVGAILQDLDDAFELLPEVYANIPDDDDYNRVNGERHENRVSGLITKAIKSRVALHVASPAFNNDQYNMDWLNIATTEAAYLINKIGGIDALSGVLRDPIFYDANNDIGNQDVLWRSNYVTNTLNWEQMNYPPSLFGSGRVNPSQNFVDIFPMANGYPITMQGESGYNAQNPYQNRDPRLDRYVVVNQGRIGNRTISTYEDPANIDGINSQDVSTRTGYYLKKLLRPDVNLDPTVMQGQIHLRPLIRYTELYLIYAEAANELWGSDSDPQGNGYTARSIIAAVRKRAGIIQDGASDAYTQSVNAGQLRQLIRNERRIELSFEGFRFWDIRRWGEPMNETIRGMLITQDASESLQYTVIDNVESRNYSPYMQYGPIPFDELLKSNGQLVQNQGWE
jgi:starch-binding outer membrane protein, SusD/RagB family